MQRGHELKLTNSISTTDQEALIEKTDTLRPTVKHCMSYNHDNELFGPNIAALLHVTTTISTSNSPFQPNSISTSE